MPNAFQESKSRFGLRRFFPLLSSQRTVIISIQLVHLHSRPVPSHSRLEGSSRRNVSCLICCFFMITVKLVWMNSLKVAVPRDHLTRPSQFAHLIFFLLCRKSTRTERSSAVRSLKLPHQIWSTWESPSLATLWKTFVTTWLVYSFFLLSSWKFVTFVNSFLCKERKRTVVTRTNPVLNESTVRLNCICYGWKM